MAGSTSAEAKKVDYKTWVYYRELIDRARQHHSWQQLSTLMGKSNQGYVFKSYRHRSIVEEHHVRKMEDIVASLPTLDNMVEEIIDPEKTNARERYQALIRQMMNPPLDMSWEGIAQVLQCSTGNARGCYYTGAHVHPDTIERGEAWLEEKLKDPTLYSNEQEDEMEKEAAQETETVEEEDQEEHQTKRAKRIRHTKPDEVEDFKLLVTWLREEHGYGSGDLDEAAGYATRSGNVTRILDDRGKPSLGRLRNIKKHMEETLGIDPEGLLRALHGEEVEEESTNGTRPGDEVRHHLPEDGPEDPAQEDPFGIRAAVDHLWDAAEVLDRKIEVAPPAFRPAYEDLREDVLTLISKMAGG